MASAGTAEEQWAARWRELVERRASQMDAAYAAIGRTSADYWARRAGNPASALRRVAGDDDPSIRALLPYLSPQTTLIDVGAGAGRYALALAPRVKSIVAVEPDAAMIPNLEAGLRESGARNVTIVQSTWQDAQVFAADIVLCAHVLYPIAEAADFIRKLDQHSHRACFLVLRDIVPEPEPLGGLWMRFHGEPRCLQPGYVEAFDLLYELGIRANVNVSRVSGPSWAFRDLEGAVAATREHLILAEDQEIDGVLRSELEAALVTDGAMVKLPVDETHVGVMWWEKEDLDGRGGSI